MPIIGAHVSAAISLDLSLQRAKEIEADCTQIFISPPQQWAQIRHSKEEMLRYGNAKNKTNIGPNFIHGAYLINLGTVKAELLQKSIEWLTYALNEADQLEATGVIFHTGSSGDLSFDEALPQVVKAIAQILKNSPSKPYLILETAAGAGAVIGDTFAELGAILKQVNDPRLKICLDTCHVYAAGYDIKTKEGLDKTLEEFQTQIGIENLVAIHANDSKFEIGSKKDRHANIGEGFIGLDGFKNIINHNLLKEIPFILEVPGFKNSGPDLENIKILKSLMHSK